VFPGDLDDPRPVDRVNLEGHLFIETFLALPQRSRMFPIQFLDSLAGIVFSCFGRYRGFYSPGEGAGADRQRRLRLVEGNGEYRGQWIHVCRIHICLPYNKSLASKCSGLKGLWRSKGRAGGDKSVQRKRLQIPNRKTLYYTYITYHCTKCLSPVRLDRGPPMSPF